MRSGVREVFRFFLCFAVWHCHGRCFVFWGVFGISAWDLGVALCFGLYFGVGFGRCFVYCGSGRVDLGGGLRNGVKAFGWDVRCGVSHCLL